jgi:hypothetical protein
VNPISFAKRNWPWLLVPALLLATVMVATGMPGHIMFLGIWVLLWVGFIHLASWMISAVIRFLRELCWRRKRAGDVSRANLLEEKLGIRYQE